MVRSYKLKISVILIIVCCFCMTVMFGCNFGADGDKSSTPTKSSVSVVNSVNGNSSASRPADSAGASSSAGDEASAVQSAEDASSGESAAFSGNAPGKPVQEETYSAH